MFNESYSLTSRHKTSLHAGLDGGLQKRTVLLERTPFCWEDEKMAHFIFSWSGV